MKRVSNISAEVLAAYIEGNATAQECRAILEALPYDAELREILQISELVDYSVLAAEQVPEVIPMAAVAAECGEQNLCSLECERLVLEQNNIAFNWESLISVAVKSRWRKSEGTALHNVGRLLESYGLVVTRRYNSTIDDIASALSNVDYKTVIIDKEASTVTLNNPNAGIDLGFIAKGYIADKMKEYLLSNGVENALINLGGNILCVGSKPDKSAFVLGIQEPFSQGTSSIPNVSVHDKSLVTSGVYERCFYANDILYHHILDTKTGYPIDNGLWSVTILSDSSMEGDAYSTMCLCLGLEDSMELIEKTEGMEALFITADMKMYYSSGFPKD